MLSRLQAISDLPRGSVQLAEKTQSILQSATTGDEKWLELCLANPESIHAVGSDGESALHRAVANEHINMVTILLNKGLPANILDANDRTALHWLSIRQTPKQKLSAKQKRLIITLLEAGCDLVQTDKHKATVMHYAAMKGNWPLCELFAEKNNSLLLKRDIFEMTPRDRATFWHKRVTSRRLRHAEAEYNLKSDTREHSKLLKLKKNFCKMQMDAIKATRHDVCFFSDVAFKGFLTEKELVDGYFSNTLHEDELTNGLRQRLRVSGAIEDRSKGIENIAEQQNKRRANRSPLPVITRKPVSFGPTPKSKPRARCLTEDLSQPLSSKANLPVQIVIDPRTKVPSLRRNFSDGRIYYDQDLPKLPGDVIQKACGETVTYRMLDGKEQEHFKPRHIDDNQKSRFFGNQAATEVQYHVKHTL